MKRLRHIGLFQNSKDDPTTLTHLDIVESKVVNTWTIWNRGGGMFEIVDSDKTNIFNAPGYDLCLYRLMAINNEINELNKVAN